MHASIPFSVIVKLDRKVFFLVPQFLQHHQICLPKPFHAASTKPVPANSLAHTSPAIRASPYIFPNWQSWLLYLVLVLNSPFLFLILFCFPFFLASFEAPRITTRVNFSLLHFPSYNAIKLPSPSFLRLIHCISHAKLIPLLLLALIMGCLHSSFHILQSHQTPAPESLAKDLGSRRSKRVSPLHARGSSLPGRAGHADLFSGHSSTCSPKGTHWYLGVVCPECATAMHLPQVLKSLRHEAAPSEVEQCNSP